MHRSGRSACHRMMMIRSQGTATTRICSRRGPARSGAAAARRFEASRTNGMPKCPHSMDRRSTPIVERGGDSRLAKRTRNAVQERRPRSGGRPIANNDPAPAMRLGAAHPSGRTNAPGRADGSGFRSDTVQRGGGSPHDDGMGPREIGHQLGPGLRALLPGRLAGTRAPGFAERAVVDRVEAELVIETGDAEPGAAPPGRCLHPQGPANGRLEGNSPPSPAAQARRPLPEGEAPDKSSQPTSRT